MYMWGAVLLRLPRAAQMSTRARACFQPIVGTTGAEPLRAVFSGLSGCSIVDYAQRSLKAPSCVCVHLQATNTQGTLRRLQLVMFLDPVHARGVRAWSVASRKGVTVHDGC